MDNKTPKLGLPLAVEGHIAPQQSLVEGYLILDSIALRIQENIDEGGGEPGTPPDISEIIVDLINIPGLEGQGPDPENPNTGTIVDVIENIVPRIDELEENQGPILPVSTQIIVGTSAAPFVHRYDIVEGTKLPNLDSPPTVGPVYSIRYSADESYFVVTSANNQGMQRYNADGSAIPTPPVGAPVFGMDISPDSRYIAVMCNPNDAQNRLRVFDTTTGEYIIPTQQPGGIYTNPKFSPDGGQFAVGGFGGPFRVYNTETWEPLPGTDHITGSSLCVAYNGPGNHMILGTVASNAPAQVGIFYREGFELKFNKLIGGNSGSNQIVDIDCDPAGIYTAVIFSGSGAEELQILGGEDYETLHILPLPNQGRAVSFSRNGKLLAVGFTSVPYIRVYDTTTWQVVGVIASSPGSDVHSIDFAPF